MKNGSNVISCGTIPSARRVARKFVADSPGHDAIHHQPVAEAMIGGTQDAFAQQPELRVQHGERGVVADGADVTEVVGESLQLGQQRPQPDRPRRDIHGERRFHRQGEGESKGHGAVAGYAPGERRRTLD